MRHSFSGNVGCKLLIVHIQNGQVIVIVYGDTFTHSVDEAIPSHVRHQTNTEIIRTLEIVQSVGSSYLFWIHGRIPSIIVIFCLQYACIWVPIASYIGL